MGRVPSKFTFGEDGDVLPLEQQGVVAGPGVEGQRKTDRGHGHGIETDIAVDNG